MSCSNCKQLTSLGLAFRREESSTQKHNFLTCLKHLNEFDDSDFGNISSLSHQTYDEKQSLLFTN